MEILSDSAQCFQLYFKIHSYKHTCGKAFHLLPCRFMSGELASEQGHHCSSKVTVHANLPDWTCQDCWHLQQRDCRRQKVPWSSLCRDVIASEII